MNTSSFFRKGAGANARIKYGPSAGFNLSSNNI
jgi:hypothetical protein